MKIIKVITILLGIASIATIGLAFYTDYLILKIGFGILSIATMCTYIYYLCNLPSEDEGETND